MSAVAVAGAATERRMPAPAARLSWLRERGMGATILISAISTAFGVLLISATGYIAAQLQAIPFYGSSDTLHAILAILGMLLLAVAVYVAGIVTANTFATIVAGRTRQIALMRLIGASARSCAKVFSRSAAVDDQKARFEMACGWNSRGTAVIVMVRLLRWCSASQALA